MHSTVAFIHSLLIVHAKMDGLAGICRQAVYDTPVDFVDVSSTNTLSCYKGALYSNRTVGGLDYYVLYHRVLLLSRVQN